MTFRQHSSSYKKKERKHAATCLYRNSWDHWPRMLQKSLPQKEEATCAAPGRGRPTRPPGRMCKVGPHRPSMRSSDTTLINSSHIWTIQGKGLSSKVGVPQRLILNHVKSEFIFRYVVVYQFRLLCNHKRIAQRLILACCMANTIRSEAENPARYVHLLLLEFHTLSICYSCYDVPANASRMVGR